MNAEDSPPISMRRRALLLAGVAVVVVVLLALSSARLLRGDSKNPFPGRGEFRPGEPLADIELRAAAGPVTLTDLVAGQPALLYFGYTNCPDFCPLTLNAFAEIKRQLGGHGDAVAYVFVSVDGSRDTPEVVDRYVSRFDQVFVGLTGAEDSVRELGRSLGLWFQRASSGSELEYTIDHTTDIYLIGADGTAVRAYPFDAPLTDIIADLRMELDAAGMPGIASP